MTYAEQLETAHHLIRTARVNWLSKKGYEQSIICKVMAMEPQAVESILLTDSSKGPVPERVYARYKDELNKAKTVPDQALTVKYLEKIGMPSENSPQEYIDATVLLMYNCAIRLEIDKSCAEIFIHENISEENKKSYEDLIKYVEANGMDYMRSVGDSDEEEKRKEMEHSVQSLEEFRCVLEESLWD